MQQWYVIHGLGWFSVSASKGRIVNLVVEVLHDSKNLLMQVHVFFEVDEQGDLQILERRGQAADHPVSASCLESDYLKCLICRVA